LRERRYELRENGERTVGGRVVGEGRRETARGREGMEGDRENGGRRLVLKDLFDESICPVLLQSSTW